MTQRRLQLSRTALNRIEAQARDSVPRESCGVLQGVQTPQAWRVTDIEASPNLAPIGRNDRFEIDPAILLRIQKATRAGAPPMIGVYHSHPEGKAEPSQTDLAQAWQIGFIWLITALSGSQVESRAYLRGKTGFIPVPLQITETDL